jgi:hypothetical protein
MKGKTILSILKLAAGMTLILALLLVTGGTAGQYHVGALGTLICYDCHTIHFSMQHKWESGDAVTPGPPQIVGQELTGDWIGTTGPNEFLLKAPANELCKTCHNGQTFAPDVFGANINASPSQGRETGALNETGANDAGYDTWKGHTLDSTNVPPGYNPALVGWTGTYNATNGLECTNCHLQHGSASVWRNLGPRGFSVAQPTYVISTTNDTTVDVWVNLASYTPGSGNATTFNPYYDRANIFFNRNDATVGSVKTSNRMGTFCARCHATFHGGGGDTLTVGGTPSGGGYEEFLRHPTAQTTIGSLSGGHSTLSRYVGATTKVKVNSDNSGTNGTNGTFTDASPFCETCHKAHGNQNPFGLIFLNRNAASVDEQGGYAGGQTQDTATGYRNLCGQCHGQGN